MLDKIKRKFAKRVFDFQIREIRDTPPIKYRESPWTILSMISHRDLAMYLLAVKSFYAQLGGGRIRIIDDGSLTQADKVTLNSHLVHPTIVSRKDIAIGSFLPHIMWERLAYAVDLSASEYVIQLDADTLTLGPIEEVRINALENRPFIQGTRSGQTFVSVAEASAFAATTGMQDHILTMTEKALVRLPGAERLKYVRGSAGLAGLAKQGFPRRRAEELCQAMAGLVGDRFAEWGTDQVAFNLMVSNSPGAVVLPFPAFCINAEQTPGASRFLHFIGSHRFDGGDYARLGRRFIAAARATA